MSNSKIGTYKTKKFIRRIQGFIYCSVLLFIGAAFSPAFQGQQAAKSPTASKTEEDQKTETHAAETLVDSSIPNDSGVDKLLEPYRPKVQALELKIGTVDRKLQTGGMGAGSLGNFVADGIRAQASARLGKSISLAITNGGGLRKSSLAEGDLRERDIFELLPFENKLIEMDLTGDQLLALLRLVLAKRHAQSGARITYRFNDNKPELITAKLVSSTGTESKINPRETYKLVTIDYLLNLQSGGYSMLQHAKNIRPIGVSIRDAIIDYVKAETAANRRIHPSKDDRFKVIGPEPTERGTGKQGKREKGEQGKEFLFPCSVFWY